MTITIEKRDEATLFVSSDDYGIEQELNEFFTFDVPGARFMPAFKNKIWDGKARMYDIRRKTLPVGLADYVRLFADKNEYPVIDKTFDERDNLTTEEVQKFVDSLNLHTGGRKIALRDYQVEAIRHAINHNGGLLLSPTSSGKSAIIYCYVRWHLRYNRRIILMVPTTSLVEQMFSDFDDYSSEDEWDVNEHVHKLYGGQEKSFDLPVLITTWQSIHSITKKDAKSKLLDAWDVYIGDEAHLFASKSILEIATKLRRAKYRLGTTGTLQDAKVSKLTLEGSFGPVHVVTTTRELMDRGQVTNLKITTLVLEYPIEERKLVKKVEYRQELDFIIGHKRRLAFTAKLAKACKGNTLVLFEFVEKHGKPLHKLIREVCGEDRPLFYISGEVSVDERERIRQVLNTHNDAIVVASFKTLSTGVNIPSIENIIFASPGKSKIRNLQSIGRGLRLKDGKEMCRLFDIADDLSTNSKGNFSLNHMKARLEQYREEQLEFSIKHYKI